MQYSTGQFNPVTNTYPAIGYPAGWTFTLGPSRLSAAARGPDGDWNPSTAIIVLSHGVNAGPYFDLKAKQKTDLNANGYYEFMDPWGRPYMYRAYPQWAWVTGGRKRTGSQPGHADAWQPFWSRRLRQQSRPQRLQRLHLLRRLQLLHGDEPGRHDRLHPAYRFRATPFFNGTFTFQGAAYNLGSNPNENQVIVTFSTAPPSITGVTSASTASRSTTSRAATSTAWVRTD